MRIRQILAGEKGLSRTDVIGAVSFVCKMTKEELLRDIDSRLDEATLNAVKDCLGERRAGKPLAYITGVKEFFSESFFVSPDVLIPRPETEILVEEALKIIGTGGNRVSILDMGTGSGAIGIIVAKHAGSNVVCVDISAAALRVASKNAGSIGVADKTRFVCSDLFGAIKEGPGFDVILANLPYVAASEWEDLMADVRQYEPRGALYGGQRGVEIYERFVRGLPGRMKSGGHVLLEIGSPAQAAEVGGMLKEIGLTVNVKKDYSGTERVLVGHG